MSDENCSACGSFATICARLEPGIRDTISSSDTGLKYTDPSLWKHTEGITCCMLVCSSVFIYFYSKTNQMHQCIKLFYFSMTQYMFRPVFPSSIRSSRLYIQKQAFAVCAVLNSLFYFRMTPYMFRMVFPSVISSSRLYIQQQAYVTQILQSAC